MVYIADNDMKTFAEIEQYILEMPNSYKDYPFEEGVAVYKIQSKEKMYAIAYEKSLPVRISLKCDPQLAILLREKYESVLPGFHLNKRHWNTIICSGQIDDDEIKDLIRHSYELVKEINP